jgi:hypothetical protein
MENTESPSLYGLNQTNRQGKNLWGKNQFNSTFPTSLACYMRDHKMEAVYVNLTDDLKTQCTEISIDHLFNTKLPNDHLYFDFEAHYEPFDGLIDHRIERVDLVIREAKVVAGKRRALRPLEIKLTVIPDNTTCKNQPDAWFPEMVIRPASIMYCAMSMASNLEQSDLKAIFHSVGKDVRQWGNEAEARQVLPKAVQALNQLHRNFYDKQQPLILQPIWRTKGKKPLLDDHAFDIFVWSDYALLRVVLDLVIRSPSDITRFARTVLRLTRYLYEYGRAGVAHIDNIFSDMTYGHQSDKEFSINGTITQRYMSHPRMSMPILGKEVVRNIILYGGEEYLSPERRLDQTIYFAYKEE